MHPTCTRSAAALLLSAAFCMLPGTATAGGAFYIKGGAMRLQDDGQMIDSQQRTFDDTSYKSIGIGWEARKKNGLAFCIEYLNYRNEFTPPADGEAKTHVLQFGAKKYFFDSGVFHPYVGAGVGPGRTNVSYTSSGVSITEEDFAIVLHAALGMELRFDNLSFMLEAKHLYFDVEGGGNQYDPTATGLLVGMGFNW
jgi:opacity protein-like surface antigen